MHMDVVWTSYVSSIFFKELFTFPTPELSSEGDITLLISVVILVLFVAVCCLCFLFERKVNRKCERSTENVV